MAIQKSTLFTLFGDFTDVWPTNLIRENPGIPGPGSLPPDPTDWLFKLNKGVDLFDIRTGAEDGRVTVSAKLTVDNARTDYPEGFPFVIASMPDVEFRILTIGGSRSVQLFASLIEVMGENGIEHRAEVVLEGLPVEIRLPVGLVTPHPDAGNPPLGSNEFVVGEFPGDHPDDPPASIDDLEIRYRQDEPTSILIHVRLHITESGGISIRPVVPISFGKCMFFELPCLAVHDFNLFPSPELVPETVEWIRHSVMPFIETSDLPFIDEAFNGQFAVRSIHFDPSQEPFKSIATRINDVSNNLSATEFVLDDLVVPFFSATIIPIPRHITVGVRRSLEDPTDPSEIFTLRDAPVKVTLSQDPPAAFVVESFFYKSLPFDQIEVDSGVRFSAGLVFLEPNSFSDEPISEKAFIFSLGENWAIRMAYRRGFTSAEGLPEPGEGEAHIVNSIFHLEIVTIQIDLMGLQVGYSLGRAIGEGASFLNSAEFTVDLFIYMPPTGESNDSFFKLRALNGEKVAFALEGLGWRQGSLHVDGISLPDGVIAMFGPVGIVIRKIGLLAENGASYLTFDAGVLIKLPSGFSGGVELRRMRFRLAGNEDAPFFRLDGIFARFTAGSLLIEAGGYYTETEEGGVRVREFGFTGSLSFKLAETVYLIALDMLKGTVKSPSVEFDYFMFQVFFRGSIPILSFELRGIRLLFADDMQPKLTPADEDSQELRYYNWYKTSNPLDVPGDRRLAAWEPRNNAWAFGIGFSGSIAALGKACELGVFVLVVNSDDEEGVLIVGDIRAFKNPDPLGYFVVESDGKSDRFTIVIGVDLRVENFVDNAPGWVSSIGQISGTIFISNDPGTFAIGRLNDPNSWFGLRWKTDLFVKTNLFIGFCLELVEDGPKGFGLIVRLDGEIDAKIFLATFNATFGLLAASFSTGSSDYAVAIWIEAGIRTKLFGFLRIGLSTSAELRNVGSQPSRSEMVVKIRLETPWFLPDVSWTFEIDSGQLLTEKLAAFVTPLRSASAREGTSQNSLPIHAERFDQNWDGTGTTSTFSIDTFQSGGATEAERLSRFEANNEIQPIATDSTIEVEWSVMVNDQLSLDPNVAPDLGNQTSGDLELTYDLVQIKVRRRPRFGSDRSWKDLEERIELDADFSDPDGVDLSGSFDPQVLSKSWDPDIQVGDETATKKLLINGATPFSYITKNPEVDESLVDNNPKWPCCRTRDQSRPRFKIHELIFREEMPGTELDSPRFFTESKSRLRFMRPSYVRPHQFGTTLPANALVSFTYSEMPGPFFRAELDQAAAFCFVRAAWQRSQAILHLLAFDDVGKIVAERQILMTTSSNFQNIILAGQGPIHRLEGRLLMRAGQMSDGVSLAIIGPLPRLATIEIDRIAYVGLRPYLDNLRFLDGCDPTGVDLNPGYEGRGQISFLPNYEYEIAFTNRLTVNHPSKQAESTEVTEYVYFKTKGLPGLNAVKRVGEEIEPYVNNAYSGGLGLLYREEPVALAFNEDFYVAVPLTVRPPGTSEEHQTLLRMQLLVQPTTAPAEETTYTTTGEDWIVANRKKPGLLVAHIWKGALTHSSSQSSGMISRNPFRIRLATLTQRDQVQCQLKDPLQVTGTVLIAPPQGTPDPDEPSREIWPGSTSFVATVRREGSGFVDRRGFDPVDKTAFTFSPSSGDDGSAAWSVVDGELHTGDGLARRFAIFGESDWDHLFIQVSFISDVNAAGIGVSLPSGGSPSRGLFAMVEKSGNDRQLVIYQRESGGQFDRLDEIDLPGAGTADAPLTLTVTTFDDILRASVGETILDVAREEFRAGRLCLVAQGSVHFTSLQVMGLDLYQFPFSVSRYTSFKEHITSFNGVIDILAPNMLGPGTTTKSSASLWAATRDRREKVMQAGSPRLDRQSLFDQWIGDLGLPLKDELTRLEISRFVVANKTELFLLESPEPLDFTEEIKLNMFRRIFSPVSPFGEDIVVSNELAGLETSPEDGGSSADDADGEGVGDFPVVASPPSDARVARRALRDLLFTAEHEGRSLPELEDFEFENEITESSPPAAFFKRVPVQLLQDGTGQRVLVIPVSGGTFTPLANGTYSMAFILNRKRWDTTDPPDELNHYRQTAAINFRL